VFIENMNQTPIDQYGRGIKLYLTPENRLVRERRPKKKQTIKKRKEKETNIVDHT